MPVVDVDPDELRSLTGHDEKSDEELKEDMFGLGLEFEGETEDGEFQLEFAPDRLDRLSVEGVARSLRYQYGDDRGVYVPKTNDPDWTIEVDESVPDERPYVTGAVIRGVNLSESALDSLIQLQEKLHATMGRKRVKGAIGIHDLTMLKGTSAGEDGGNSIQYVGVEPDEDVFVPLDSDVEMTPAEVLTDHPTGEKYADVIADYERYPAIYDDIGLFSFPPVINGRRTEVSTESRDLFVELTGTDQWTIDKMCNIICYALDARGATIEEVTVDYPDKDVYAGDKVELVAPDVDLVRPNFETSDKTVRHSRIESLLGINLDPEEVVDLLERAGLDAIQAENDDGELVYEVDVPPYRVDVLHPLDIVDDVGRAYGFNELEPTYPEVGTVGGRHERTGLEDAVRDQLVGLGFEDMLNFHMINERENYERMRLDPDADDCLGAGQPVTITEPYSEDYTMVRSWALPSLMMVLENNTHRSYPQDIAEVGFAAHYDDSVDTYVAERRTVAGALARHDASYEDAKARLQALARNFEVELTTPPTTHPSFIDGRTAEVRIDGEVAGVVGEVHPAVLVEHDLEVPVTAFEFDLDAL
ncbi:phenylalanine--tRNA ligase subunit beta [Haloarchaeobius sp. HME9146]|uniref:phenylalanine--tRNA ligase subunit beta n=1 Tax=Haloarchaeobius sp. HME9146 TaxID=2978732 RepID=UPI0021C1AD03|nr:phenylalanine--tRNA ligase subunit beta [Haloarchaeobius sp. HME9146]MCT9095156.1 phenylalanine--tRNA ligase subunit beta [Haloarchaeobius sp. HME9146]